MKSPSTKVRFEEAKLLLDYGFNNFNYYQFGKKDTVIKNVSVSKGNINNVDLVIASDCGTLLSKGEENNITQSINVPDNVSAPFDKGTIVGNITYSLDGKEIGKADIVTANSVNKLSFITLFQKVFNNWINFGKQI